MNKTIVLIEDAVAIRESLMLMFELEGFTAYAAANGATGIALIEQVQPDLILSDYLLPDIDGGQILKTVRENPALHSTAFVFLSAIGRQLEEEQTTYRADRYLNKPVDPVLLLQVVRELLD